MSSGGPRHSHTFTEAQLYRFQQLAKNQRQEAILNLDRREIEYLKQYLDATKAQNGLNVKRTSDPIVKNEPEGTKQKIP